MSWFSARIIYVCILGNGQESRGLREESIRVLLADSEAAARQRAEVIGRQNEHEYRNSEGNLVSWRFVVVEEVQDLSEDEIVDGTEVFSRMYDDS